MPPSETALRCHVSEVAPRERRAVTSPSSLLKTTAFNLVGTCLTTNLQVIGDPRAKSIPELNEHQVGDACASRVKVLPSCHTHDASRMQPLRLWSCAGDDPRTTHDRWVKMCDDPRTRPCCRYPSTQQQHSTSQELGSERRSSS